MRSVRNAETRSRRSSFDTSGNEVTQVPHHWFFEPKCYSFFENKHAVESRFANSLPCTAPRIEFDALFVAPCGAFASSVSRFSKFGNQNAGLQRFKTCEFLTNGKHTAFESLEMFIFMCLFVVMCKPKVLKASQGENNWAVISKRGALQYRARCLGGQWSNR